MPQMTPRTLFTVTVAAALLLAAMPASAAGPIETEISLVSHFLKGTENVVVNYSMTNVTDQPVRVLLWNTPFDGIEGNLFEVARNGELVPYLGRVYKRGTPQPEDFMTLEAGETRVTKVELSAYYEMNFTGEYQLRARNESFDHAPLGQLPLKGQHGSLLDLGSNSVIFWIDGEEPPLADIAPLAFDKVIRKAKPVRETCSNERKAILANALAAAQGIAGNASSYLSSGQNPSSPRYTEWFGAFSSGRWNTVDSNFQAIDDALNNANVEFDCKCKQRYYAYVYPNEPYKIYLCRVFWDAPLTGTDSQAGTLVHEMSHFNVVAGTDDVTYGQNSCRSLAISNPNSAIQNADSHEYFAENTPFLN